MGENVAYKSSQDFQMAGNVPSWQNLGPRFFKWQPSRKSWGGETCRLRRLSPREIIENTILNKNAHSMHGGDCDAAIAKAAAALNHAQSQSQEVGSGDEVLGLLCFDLSSAETDFWWLEDEQ